MRSLVQNSTGSKTNDVTVECLFIYLCTEARIFRRRSREGNLKQKF